MSVSVRIPTILRTYTGGESEVSAEGDTWRRCSTTSTPDYPGIQARVLDDQGAIRRFVNVYVGNDDVRFLRGPRDQDPGGHAGLGDPRGRRRLPRARVEPGRSERLQRPPPATQSALCRRVRAAGASWPSGGVLGLRRPSRFAPSAAHRPAVR